MLETVLVGFWVAFVAALPMAGPVGALAVREALSARSQSARVLVLGSALVEGLFAALAWMGFALFFDDAPEVLAVMRIVAMAILFAVGVLLLREASKGVAHQVPNATAGGQRRLATSFLTGLGLTVINPTMIISWSVVAATTAGAGLAEPSVDQAGAFGVAVAAGLMASGAVIIGLLDRFRERIDVGASRWIYRVLAAVLFVAALALLWQTVIG